MQTDFLSLDKETQKQIVETLIFASELPLSLENIIDIIDKKLDFTSFKTKKSNNAIEEISNFEEYLTSLIEEINSDWK